MTGGCEKIKVAMQGFIELSLGRRSLFLSPCILSCIDFPPFFDKYGFNKGKDMMIKRLWHLISVEEKGRKSIKAQTTIIKRYKNGNFKIEGQRSITPGNWKRKRTMLLHHREVREYKEFYEFKGTYLEAVRAKGKEVEEGKGMFIESMQKYIG